MTHHDPGRSFRGARLGPRGRGLDELKLFSNEDLKRLMMQRAVARMAQRPAGRCGVLGKRLQCPGQAALCRRGFHWRKRHEGRRLRTR